MKFQPPGYATELWGEVYQLMEHSVCVRDGVEQPWMVPMDSILERRAAQ